MSNANAAASSSVSTVHALAVGDLVRIEKGCAARGFHKGSAATVLAVEALGAEHSHAVRVQLKVRNRGDWADTVVSWYARHVNRLNDAIVSMNDGDPTHKIAIRRS